MAITILRPSQHIAQLGNDSMLITAPRGGAVAGDWWDPNSESLAVVAAYRAKGAASYAASKVNAANPGTYDLSEGNGAVPWASGSGWGFIKASAQWLDTGIKTDVYARTVLAQFAGAVPGATSGYLCGAYDNPGVIQGLAPRLATGLDVVRYANHWFTNYAPGLAAGNIAFAQERAFRNGSYEGHIGTSVGVPVNQYMFIGAIDSFPSTTGYITASIYALVIYDAKLSDAQVSTVATAMAAL